MNQQEIAKVLEVLEDAYGVKKFYADSDKARVLRIWNIMFRDDDAIEVNRAVIDCIATLRYSPTIADIKTRMAQNRMEGQMTELEAWALIRRACEDSNGREESQKAYQSLPKILQKLCNPSQLRAWRAVPDKEFETVIASNFQRSYAELAKREAGYHALPPQLQQSEQWRVEGPKQEELPAPKKLSYEKPEWMIRREELENEQGRTEDNDVRSWPDDAQGRRRPESI